MRRIALALLLALFPVISFAQGVVVKSGVDSNLATVNSGKAILTAQGSSGRVTYITSGSGLAGATLHTLSIEAAAGTGFKLLSWCVGVSNATAASSIAVQVHRRSTASSAGTACTNEGTTASCAVSKMDPSDANFTGVTRIDGTLGTIGALLDQQQIEIGIIATGAGSERPFCKEYGSEGEKIPIVAAGTANGLSISVPTMGAGSLATSITAVFVFE